MVCAVTDQQSAIFLARCVLAKTLHCAAVRLTLEPLSAPAGVSQLPIRNTDGVVVSSLWSHVLTWHCRGGTVSGQILAAEPIELPTAEATEPVAGLLARVIQALHGHGGLLLLRHPAQVFSHEQIALAHGVRLFEITTSDDEARWDALLSQGQPVYGVRGTLACACRTPHPGAVIAALAYGTFTCEENLPVTTLDETNRGVSWVLPRSCTAKVVIRDGFEAASISGEQGQWQDRGHEGYVRVVFHAADGHAWTQPRFIAPVRPANGACQ